MKRFEVWLISISTIIVGVTGVALYAMKNWLVSTDPFAVVNHPAQPWMLRVHLVGIPFLIFGTGLFFSDHVVGRLRRGVTTGRRSGIGLLAIFAPMAISGILIQVLTVDSWVEVAVGAHLLSGTIYFAGFLFHSLRHRRPVIGRRARPHIKSDAPPEPNRFSSV